MSINRIRSLVDVQKALFHRRINGDEISGKSGAPPLDLHTGKTMAVFPPFFFSASNQSIAPDSDAGAARVSPGAKSLLMSGPFGSVFPLGEVTGNHNNRRSNVVKSQTLLCVCVCVCVCAWLRWCVCVCYIGFILVHLRSCLRCLPT